MAEQENIAIVQKLYAAFSVGDVQTILNNATPNAEWINHGPATVPYFGNFTGRLPAFFQAIGESTTDAKVSASKFIAQGDTVASVARYTATVRSSGAKIDTPLAHIFTVRDGKVTSWIGFSDSAAVAAAHTGTAASARR
jgi:ketosteroid isomerase-like protein